MRIAFLLTLCWPLFTFADEPAKDTRLASQKTLDSYFPFTPPKTLESWTKRKLELREQLLLANGLWPMPEKKALDPVIHGKFERNGVTIEKVFFKSLPGHYVTGNLYRPTVSLEKNPAAKNGKLPAVLFAHGHWKDGRFHQASKNDAERWVKTKGEADLDRGYFFMQAIPTQLARMGFVVFQYDMVGYADSLALPHGNGFADVQGELHLQSAMGLQTWNSIRAMDFVLTLPEVDSKRVGMTGASGGGTQTFLSAAIDDRLAAAFPAVMVSTSMQGGCVCENCSYLRVDTGNVEMAALFAPKPLAMSCANDWTKEFLTKGFPDLQQLYKLYGKPENVAAKAWLEYPHNYNQPAREFMYHWFNKHLAGKDEPVAEQPYQPTPVKELSVFDATRPRPQDELKVAELRAVMQKSSQAQFAAMIPKDAQSMAEYRGVVGTALWSMVGGGVPGTVKVSGYSASVGLNGVAVHDATLSHVGGNDAVPARGLIPKGFNGTVVFWLHPKGIASQMEDGKYAPAVQQLLDKNCAVFSIDLFQSGKTLNVDKRFAGYTYGYNRTLLAQRIADTLLGIGNLKHNAKAKSIHLVGWGEAGPIAVLAKSLARGDVTRTAAEVDFSFDKITSTSDPMMLPGALKYGGLDGLLAVCAPDPVLLHADQQNGFSLFTPAAYKLTGAEQLRIEKKKLSNSEVIEWITK
jgi:hypothetical protein